MRRSLLNNLNLTKCLRQALVLFTLLLLPSAAWGQITVVDVQLNNSRTVVTHDDINSIKKGTVTYDPYNNILTLEDADITYEGSIIIAESLKKLTIDIIGNNTIKTTSSDPVITRTGDASPEIEFTSSTNTGSLILEYAGGDSNQRLLELITPSGLAPKFLAPETANDWSSATKAEIKALGLTVAGVTATTGNCTDILTGDNKGKVSFTPAEGSDPATLTLAGVNIGPSSAGIVWSGFYPLKIKYSGNNIINTRTESVENEEDGYCIFYNGSNTGSPALSLSASDDASTLVLKPSNGESNSRAAITRFSVNCNGWGMYYSDDCSQVTDATNPTPGKEVVISKSQPLGLSVGGVLVTSENKEDVLNDGGKVKFTPATQSLDGQTPSTPATLTLNSATINGPIKSNIDNLVVHLIGHNTISGVSASNKPFQYTGSNNTGSLAFTQEEVEIDNSSVFGRLNASLEDTSSFSWTDGYTISTTFETTENTGWVQETGSTSATIRYVEYYDLWISSMHFNSENLSGISGGTKFYPKTNTLHLEGFGSSDEIIKSQLADLIIEVSGSGNTPKAILYEGSSNGTLLIKNAPSSSSTVNKLTLKNSTGAVISGFSTVTLDGLIFSTPNYPSVTTSNDWNSNINEAIITNGYDITIGDVDVTTANKDDVLNDGGKVKFTPADNTASPATPATLTLDGAEITGTVSWNKSAPLTIAINGTNSVTTTGAPAIEGNNQDNTTLTFAKVSETGKCKLILSGSTDESISGFKNSSDTYAGSGLVYYEDYDYTKYTATISSTLSGSGTSTDPYLIETPEDLKDFSFFVNKQIITNKYIKIANNIDCDGLEGFESIGSSYPFMGTLSGYGNTISNLTINSGLGFFGHISGGIVNDLNFYKLSVTGNSYATGGIASDLSAGGQIDNCTLTECTIACLDNQESPEVGGIVARLSDSGSKISNCVVYNSTINASTIRTGVSEPIGYAGGIVASYSSGTITNCHVKDDSKIINVNADGGSTLKTGAIVGNVSNETTTSITSNFYYYDVTVETQLGSSDKETKSGYTPRGTSDNTEDPTGAVLYTKNVIIPVSGNAGLVSIGSDYYYKATSDDTNTTYSAAPDVEVVISVENAVVEGSYTLENEIKTIELKPKEGSTGLYTFEMPNADVTFTVQETAAVHFSEGGQIYASYYNATKDVAVPKGMTAYIVTGVSDDGTKVVVSPVSYIKAGVAVIIEKDKTTEVSETTDFSGNILIYAEDAVPATESTKLYVLYNNKYLKVTSGTIIPSGHCYLDLNDVANTRGFYEIGGDGDGTTAIQKVASEKRADDKWYDLQGRRLSAKPTKSGLYLHNGTKVVIK